MVFCCQIIAYDNQYYVLMEVYCNVYKYFSVAVENFDDPGYVPGAFFDLAPNVYFAISPRKLNQF